MKNNESWNLEDFDQESISSHRFELDQFQTLDKLASFPFNQIELGCECDPDAQPCDSVPVRIYVDSGILTQFGPIFRDNIYSHTHKSRN